VTGGQNAEKFDETEIKAMIKALGDIRPVIQAAEPADKAKVYKELGLQLTYEPGKQIVRAQVILGPDIRGVIGSVRGGTCTITPNNPWRRSGYLQLAGLAA
jgi:hypothetical protein